MNTLLYLCGSLVAAGALTFAINWLGLFPWRRSRAKHWTEQARMLFPLRRAASTNLWSVPAVLAMLVYIYRPDTHLWIVTFLGAAVGASIGSFSLDREIYPAIPCNVLLRWTFISLFTRLLVCMVFVSATVWMPNRLDWRAFAIAGGVAISWFVWAHAGVFWLWRKLGVLKAAPERLEKIVRQTATRMGISFREVLVLDAPLAQAAAMPSAGKLLFTEYLLTLLPDDQLAAICAHELAHLGEPWSARYSRYISLLAWLPWMLIKPLFCAWGGVSLVSIAIVANVIPRLVRNISNKLETRADSMAGATEDDPGTYARTLAHLYEANLLPAVHGKATHPNLYDRMLAAGVTPEYPKPKAAKMMAWHGVLLMFVAGCLVAYILINA